MQVNYGDLKYGQEQKMMNKCGNVEQMWKCRKKKGDNRKS